MIRVTYITLDKTDRTYIHVFSVFEQMMTDMQDIDDVGNWELLPSDKRPSGYSSSKDNLTFHARVLPNTTNWKDVVSNPLHYMNVDGNTVQYHTDAVMQEVECNMPSLFDFNQPPKTTLTSIIPYRKSGGCISRHCDSVAKVSNVILNSTHLKKQLQYLTLRLFGFDLTQYPEHIGNVHLIKWNPLFREVDNWIDQSTGRVHLHFLYHENSIPDIIVRATGINRSKAPLFDQELCRVTGQKYIDVQLPTIPKVLTLRYYDEKGNLWMECSTTGKPISIVGTMMAMGTPTKIKTASKRGKERTIEIQKGEKERFGIHQIENHQSFLNEEIEHQRFISDEQSFLFVFFDGDKNHPEYNEHKATRIVRSILSKDCGKCFICDPYFDYYAFDKFIWPMEDMCREVHIVNCQECMGDENKLKNTIQIYHQHIKREQVKCHVITGKEILHDRFILLENEGWLIGSSFNEFGNRASTIVKMPKSACVTLRKQVEAWINDTSICHNLF